jgi:hypothetical protein
VHDNRNVVILNPLNGSVFGAKTASDNKHFDDASKPWKLDDTALLKFLWSNSSFKMSISD